MSSSTDPCADWNLCDNEDALTVIIGCTIATETAEDIALVVADRYPGCEDIQQSDIETIYEFLKINEGHGQSPWSEWKNVNINREKRYDADRVQMFTEFRQDKERLKAKKT